MSRIAAILMASALLTFRAQSQSSTNDFEWYTKLKQVSAPETGIMYGVDYQDRILGWNGREWQPIAGSLSQISAGSINDVWGVNPAHYVWRLNANKQFENVPGTMRMVAVAKGGGEVVGLDLNGRPVIWNGSGSWLPIRMLRSRSISMWASEARFMETRRMEPFMPGEPILAYGRS